MIAARLRAIIVGIAIFAGAGFEAIQIGISTRI
jgi:hypothetical protein